MRLENLGYLLLPDGNGVPLDHILKAAYDVANYVQKEGERSRTSFCSIGVLLPAYQVDSGARLLSKI
ncbi:hypothetical protein L1887_11679 [Cichorium endivia]|nr:hypothetical protein L1887_11679 [Cichorium endivia]